MVNLALEAENSLSEFGTLQQINPHPSNETTEAVAQAAITMANHLNSAAIMVMTETGFSARLVSKYRPDCPILAVTSSERVARKLSMNWGVIPALYQGEATDEARIEFAISEARKLVNAIAGDILVITAGHTQKSGSTDLIRVVTL